MFRLFQRYITERRFKRLFVKPFEAQIHSARAKHAKNQALRAQRDFLHAALAGGKR